MEKKLTKAAERAKIVSGLIRDVWGSLDSHLDFTHKKHHDSAVFHKRTIKQYARMIEQLTRLL